MREGEIKMENVKKELQREKDFIILRSSNYHYDLGVEHERERMLGLIVKEQKKLRINSQAWVILETLKNRIKG